MLAIPAINDWWAKRPVPVVAVSPIVGGAAVKGPAAKLLSELGHAVSAHGVARHYGHRVDRWLIDSRDAAHAPAIRSLGAKVQDTDTLMVDIASSTRVAQSAIQLARAKS